MDASVRYGDGLTIDVVNGDTVVADATDPSGDAVVVSHAHADHLYRTAPQTAIWSALTRDLAALRRPDEPVPTRVTHPRIDLLNAGHVSGSRAALIDAGERILYTGDVCTRDRFSLEGFEPVPADILIVESTYGTPGYEFPPVDTVRAAFQDWSMAHDDRPIVLFGYSLGRAQEIQRLLATTDRRRVFVDPTIADVNQVIEAHLDVHFPAIRYDEPVDLRAGDALVLPSRRSGGRVDDLIADCGAVTGGLSGWATDDSFRHRRNLDASFVISDHCDFPELCDIVRAVDPEQVYTLHGSAVDFADHLTRELGYDATALKPGQRRLDEFGATD